MLSERLCYTGSMSELKTLANDASVTDFINTVENETQRQDSFTLLDIFSRITGQTAKMWGTSIIGFGQYHYKSDRSTQEGDWPLVAFSPRKQNLTLYLMSSTDEYGALLEKLGKHKTSKACLYIHKLSDVDVAVLEKIIQLSYKNMMKSTSQA